MNILKNTLKTLIFVISLTVSLITPQAHGAEDTPYSALARKITTSVEEVDKNSKEVQRRMENIIEDISSKQEALDKVREKILKLQNDGPTSAARHRAMWDEYFLRRIDLIKAALGSLESASKEIGGYADKILELISGTQDDVSALKKQLASESKLAQMKSDGRKLVTECKELKELYEATDPSDPGRPKLHKNYLSLKADLGVLMEDALGVKNRIHFHETIIDKIDKYRINVAPKLGKTYEFVASFKIVGARLENELKLTEMQKEYFVVHSGIPDPGGLSDLSKGLHNVLKDLGKENIELPDLPTGGYGGTIPVPIRAYSIEEMEKFFSE